MFSFIRQMWVRGNVLVQSVRLLHQKWLLAQLMSPVPLPRSYWELWQNKRGRALQTYRLGEATALPTSHTPTPLVVMPVNCLLLFMYFYNNKVKKLMPLPLRIQYSGYMTVLTSYIVTCQLILFIVYHVQMKM